MEKRNSKNTEREERLTMAAKIGAVLCVSVVIAVASLKNPITDDSTVLSAASSTSVSEEQANTRRDNRAEAKPYYFPSEYELRAADPGEPVPTF